MLEGRAKYKCVLSFKEQKLGGAERKAREHVSARRAMAVQCLPWVLGSKVRPLWKLSHQDFSVPERAIIYWR